MAVFPIVENIGYVNGECSGLNLLDFYERAAHMQSVIFLVPHLFLVLASNSSPASAAPSSVCVAVGREAHGTYGHFQSPAPTVLLATQRGSGSRRHPFTFTRARAIDVEALLMEERHRYRPSLIIFEFTAVVIREFRSAERPKPYHGE